jgi:hypothetical protein
MSNNLRFYLNLALVGFTLGQAYGVYRRRRVRTRHPGRQEWS